MSKGELVFSAKYLITLSVITLTFLSDLIIIHIGKIYIPGVPF